MIGYTDTDHKKTNTSDILMFPLFTFFNIIIYALKGVKALFFDIWILLLQKFRKGSGEAPVHVTYESDEERLYEKTKNRQKRTKQYKYSAATLNRLEKQKKKLIEDLQKAGATRSKEPHIYYFKVRDVNGKIITGTINGLSKLDVNAFLLNEGYEVYDIKTSRWYDFAYKESSFLGKKMRTKDLIFWLTQLSTYIKAGMTLNDSVKILNNQMKGSKARSNAFRAISYELTLGESFSIALEKQGDMFPALMINMIKAAEASGTLVETLDDLARYYTEVDETKKQMISALTYPSIILLFSVAVIVFILMYVVPSFTEIYEGYGAPITGITLLVIKASTFLKNNFFLLFITVIALIIGIIITYKSVHEFRAMMQVFLMRIPVIKNLIIYNELTIFAKTFASLLRNNVFITDSMNILSKITNNEIYRAILYKTINNIVKGEKISEAFKDHWAIPEIAYYMIVTGESTGDLAEMMQKVSEYYQGLHKNIVSNLKSFIEPVLITFLAVIVGIIMIAVIVPMFGIYDTIN